jgi:WD40 repeat protein
MLTLWSTKTYTSLVHWQDDSSSSFYGNCLAWNPKSVDEFVLGCSQGTIHFLTITDNDKIDLHVRSRQIPLLSNTHMRTNGDITACVYLPSMINFVLCTTSTGSITCWNTCLALCLYHCKIDSNEICWMKVNHCQLLTGSSVGSLKLWNIESFQTCLEQWNSLQTYIAFNVDMYH